MQMFQPERPVFLRLGRGGAGGFNHGGQADNTSATVDGSPS
jgi:hypothetical protein